MGMLFRIFAPKSIKKVRRAAHPIRTTRRAVTPRPVWKANQALHPTRVAKSAVVKAVRKSR
jgi:hypothetical protein